MARDGAWPMDPRKTLQRSSGELFGGRTTLSSLRVCCDSKCLISRRPRPVAVGLRGDHLRWSSTVPSRPSDSRTVVSSVGWLSSRVAWPAFRRFKAWTDRLGDGGMGGNNSW